MPHQNGVVDKNSVRDLTGFDEWASVHERSGISWVSVFRDRIRVHGIYNPVVSPLKELV